MKNFTPSLTAAKRYLQLRKEYYRNPRIAIEDEEYRALYLYFANCNWNESMVTRFVNSQQEEAMSYRSHARSTWHEYETRRQARKMNMGPTVAGDGHTILVPSEWYHEEAATFWKAHGFRWNRGISRWERDCEKPASGKIYSVDVWLACTRRKYFEFWPTLLKGCKRCGAQFEPRSQYQIYCNDCKEAMNQ